MFQITIQIPDRFDEEQMEFIEGFSEKLNLEHSLYSISKWEAKHKKPFLGKDEKTYEESIDYIRCMCLNDDVNEEIYEYIGNEDFNKIAEYINDSQTATWFSDSNNKPSREIVTSELVYYWMVALQIPFECQYWHFNRLMTLIRVINIKNSPKKKMSKSDIISRNRALNEARKKKLNSKG